MKTEQKQEAIKLLKQGMETIQEKSYTEIAEVPTADQENFRVKYGFIHEGTEGIFTVIGERSIGQEGTHFVLSSEFDPDLPYNPSTSPTDAIDRDLRSAENYLNEHISLG